MAISEIDPDAIIAYAALKDCDLDKELDVDIEIAKEILMNKNVGWDFQKQKSSIPRMKKDKLIKLYNADKFSNNLGDVSIIQTDTIVDHDLFTMSSPCTDYSVAGKGEGGDWQCLDCHKKFNPIESKFKTICTVCGSENIKKTRSSLLFECAKVIETKKPKYVFLENVKNLIGKKHIDSFKSWCSWLEEQGYTNYYSVLNSKMFGVPQNRERVFMISIIGEHKPYEFPQGFPLQYKLKDFLQTQVEEKYYLSDEIQSRFKFQSQGSNVIGTTAPDFRTIGQRDLVYGPDGNMGALVATDYKQPKQVIESLEVDKPVRLGGVFDEENGTRHQAGSVYDKDGISPTIDTGQGGWRQPLITEDTYVINDNETFTYNHSGNNVIGEMGGSLWDSRHESIRRVYDTETIAPSITSCQGGGTHPKVLTESIEYNGQNVELPVCVASRGRNPENPSDRTTGAPTEQRLEPNTQGTTNTITTVQKDNYILEKPFRIRKLTPFECLSLMGLKPHEIEKINKANISDTQKYKMAGNSIVVNVLEHIFANLFKENNIDTTLRK